MIDEKPLTVNTGRGFSIKYKGIFLYSRYNPVATPERIVTEKVLEEETLYIIPSPLLLYGFHSLLSRLPESSYILGIEYDQQLMKLSVEAVVSLMDYSNRFELVRLENKEQLKVVIDRLGIWKFRRCKTLALNKGFDLYRKEYNELIDFATHHINTFWRNRLTINKLGKLWIENLFKNLPLVHCVRPDNKGKAVVVCGAGPSLDKVLTFLKENRSLLYIIAVDTALSTLLEASLDPDLVYALEAQFYNLGDFHNIGKSSFSLLADLTSYPQICRMNKGPLFFTKTEFTPTILLERLKDKGLKLPELPPLGSVGVAAVYTALELFDSPLFLCGLDFSYIPGQSHSKGSPFIRSKLEKTNRYQTLENNKLSLKKNFSVPGKTDGSIIITDSILFSYGNLLKEILKKRENVYDLSSDGLPLGIPVLNPKEFNIELIKRKKKKIKKTKDKITHFDPLSFLENEKKMLLKLIKSWDCYAESDQTDIPSDLIEALKKVDYVYIDFPDRLPHPVENISFITRSVKSARHYVELINRLIIGN